MQSQSLATPPETPVELSALAREILLRISLAGSRIYTPGDADLIAGLLAHDKPSRYIDDPFYWAWFNARRSISNAAWDGFIAGIFAQNGSKATKTPLAQKGLVTDRLDSASHIRLTQLYNAIPISPFDGDDVRLGYFYDPNMTKVIGGERDLANDFRKPSAPLLEALGEWMGTLKPSLETVMGHPYRITTVRLYSLKGHTKHGPDHWHLDWWPVGMKKLQIYLGPTSITDGSTDFRLKDGVTTTHIEGPPGMWGLFENSIVFHRALPPAHMPRPTIELSIVPATQTSYRCVDGGMNAGYPWFPPEFAASDGWWVADQYVRAVEIRQYMRALQLALNAQDILCTNRIEEHVAPSTGKLAATSAAELATLLAPAIAEQARVIPFNRMKRLFTTAKNLLAPSGKL